MGELLSLFVFESEQLYYLQNIEKYSLKIIKNYYSTDVDSNGNIYMSDNDDIFEYNLNNPTQE